MRNYRKGKFNPKNPQKYIGDVNNIWYRSSWELKYLIYLDKNPSVLRYSSEEIIIPYISPIDNKPHRYFPDMFVEMKTKDGIRKYLVEIKPHKQTLPPKKKKRVTKQYVEEVMTYGVNQAKWEYAEKYCKERGWEFVKLTEHDLLT